MSRLRAGWEWFRKWAWAFVLGLVAVLGAGLVWNASRRRTARLADELAVEKARRKVAALDARRAALDERDAAHAAEIEAIREERQAIAREVVGLDADVAAMTDEEVADAFRDLY